MFQAFVIVLREGFEAFLIVSIIYAYLARAGLRALLPAMWWGIAASVVVSSGLGLFLMQGASEPFWEAVFGLVAAVMVTTLTIQMWKHGRFMKKEMEQKLSSIAERKTGRAAWFGAFLFTVFMISREGMETALMLFQVPQGHVIKGVLLGLLAVAAFCFLWGHFSRFINLQLFFQVTGIFLLLFVVQILIYSVHEFAESGVIRNSEAFHNATEPFSPEGLYGRWFSVASVVICAGWLVFAWARDKFKRLAGPGPGKP